MLGAFDNIRVINLAHRHDRRREMMAELGRANMHAEFFQAHQPADAGPFRTIGEHGVYLSHLALLREASSQGKSLLILEDDCDFTPEAKKARPPSDILWGGFSIHDDYIQGAHCMGFQAHIIARLVPYLEKLMVERGIPIDGAYLHFCRDHPEVTVDACVPPVAVQRPSHSDISGRRGLDRYRLSRPLVALLRKGKRFLQHREVGGSFEELRRRGQTAAR